MIRALTLAFIGAASPAFAHHEAVVTSVLPGLTMLILAGGAASLAAWRHWRIRRSTREHEED